jgi:hypothetical protein
VANFLLSREEEITQQIIEARAAKAAAEVAKAEEEEQKRILHFKQNAISVLLRYRNRLIEIIKEEIREKDVNQQIKRLAQQQTAAANFRKTCELIQQLEEAVANQDFHRIKGILMTNPLFEGFDLT